MGIAIYVRCLKITGNLVDIGKDIISFFSKKLRPMSEEYGLKVYLCHRHHREDPEAVHQNWRNRRILEAQGQQAFEEIYGHEKFMKVFGQNYIFEESEDEKEKEHEGASCFETGR